MDFSENGRVVAPPREKSSRWPQFPADFGTSPFQTAPSEAGMLSKGYKLRIYFLKKLPEGSKSTQTLVWGKQSVRLSACRTPAPEGENRAEARTHFEDFMKARKPDTGAGGPVYQRNL